MRKETVIPFMLSLFGSAVIQCFVVLSLWFVLPLQVAHITQPGYNATYTSHSQLPGVLGLVLAVLFTVVGRLIWRRNKAVALGLYSSAIVGVLLFLILMLQDSA
jgi:hypothetical protein